MCLSLMMIAACAMPEALPQGPPQPAPQSAPYRALGTEPFWSLTIDPRTMRFEAAGRPMVSMPTPRVINGIAGPIYQSRRLNVNIVHTPCSDGMSDTRYADTVTVRVDGRTYQGCGGERSVAAPQPSLVTGEWRVLSVARRPAAPRATISFAGNRVSGHAGCNRFGGSFELRRTRLEVGPLAVTKMACAGPGMGQEAALLDLLARELTVSSQGRRLVLTARTGRSIVLERIGRR